jgi:hypothetical protein
MIGFNGGLIGKSRPTAATSSVSGVWGAKEQEVAVRDTLWPGSLLDVYSGATAAYSLRNLRAGTSGSAVVRVRRSSDNTEQDFTAVQVTDGTLTTFCGANNGFVRTWYDQSTSSNNAIQTTASSQPRIVSSGVLDTDGGNPAIVFGSGANIHLAPAAQITIGATAAFFVVAKHTNPGGTWAFIFGENGGATFSIGKQSSTTALHITGTTFLGTDVASKAVNYFQLGTGITRYRANIFYAAIVANITSASNWRIGNRSGNTGEQWVGPIQEVIYYPSTQVATSNGIITNINSYYNIFS